MRLERSPSPGASAEMTEVRRRFALPLAGALGLWAAWTVATYLLEGRVLTLLRPEAVGQRVLYVVAANLAIGTVGAGLVLRWLSRRGWVRLARAGFGPRARSAVAVCVGAVLGLVASLARGGPSLDPVVLLNGFAQVLPVSIAEVLVCWAVVGAVSESLLHDRLGAGSAVVAAAVAASLFGAYHYAHSPPFNSHAMVAALAAVGVMTGAFFFISRDVYGTIAFHNLLALRGVVGALERGGQLDAYATPQPALLGMAAAAVALLLLVDRGSRRSVADPR